MPSNPFIPGSTVEPVVSTPTVNGAPMPGQAIAGPVEFEVDLTGMQDGLTIPDGLYHMRCIDLEQTVSKQGNPTFVWTFTVVDGPQAGKDFKMWTAVTPAAMWKVAETVIALGVGQTGQVVKFKRNDVLNRECGAMVSADEYNGRTSSKITRVITMTDYTEALRQ